MPHVSSLIAAYQRVPQNNEQKPVGTRPTNKNHPLREQILREQPFSIRENLKIDSPPERPSSIISVDISRLSSALSNRSSHGVPPLNLASSPNHHHNHNHNHNHNPNIWDFGSVRHLKQMSGRSSSEDSAVDSVFEVVTQSPQSSKSSYTYTSFLPELEDTSPHTGCHTSFLELDGDESKSLQRRTAITSPVSLAIEAINAINAMEADNRVLKERLYVAEETADMLRKENELYKNLCDDISRSKALPAPGPHPLEVAEAMEIRPPPEYKASPATPASSFSIFALDENNASPTFAPKPIKPLRPLKTRKSFLKGSTPTLEAVPASPRESPSEAVATPLTPRPKHQSTAGPAPSKNHKETKESRVPTPTKDSRGPSPTKGSRVPTKESRRKNSREKHGHKASRGPSPSEEPKGASPTSPSKEAGRDSDNLHRRSQSQPPYRDTRPEAPAGLRISHRPSNSQPQNSLVSKPNHYSNQPHSPALSLSKPQPALPQAEKTNHRFTLLPPPETPALRPSIAPRNSTARTSSARDISGVIPGSVSRHPVALHGVPLSPVKSVPVISIKEAQRRAKKPLPTPRTTMSAQVNLEPLSEQRDIQEEVKRKMSFTRLMGKLKKDKENHSRWDWI